MVKLQFFCTPSILGRFTNTYSIQRLNAQPVVPFINIRLPRLACSIYRLGIPLLINILLWSSYKIILYPVHHRSIVKISFNAEDITYLEQELKNKFSIPEPESSTSGWLSRIFHFRYFMVKYCSTVPMLSWVNLLILTQYRVCSYSTSFFINVGSWMNHHILYRLEITSTFSSVLELILHSWSSYDSFVPCASQVNFLIITNMELVMPARTASS